MFLFTLLCVSVVKQQNENENERHGSLGLHVNQAAALHYKSCDLITATLSDKLITQEVMKTAGQ